MSDYAQMMEKAELLDQAVKEGLVTKDYKLKPPAPTKPAAEHGEAGHTAPAAGTAAGQAGARTSR